MEGHNILILLTVIIPHLNINNMFIEIEIITNYRFNKKEDWNYSIILLNLNEVQQISSEDSKSIILLKNGVLLTVNTTYQELKSKINYTLSKSKI